MASRMGFLASATFAVVGGSVPVQVADNTTSPKGVAAPFDFFSAPYGGEGQAFFSGSAGAASGLWSAKLNGAAPPGAVVPLVQVGVQKLPGTQEPIKEIGAAAGDTDSMVFFAEGASPASAQIMGAAPSSANPDKTYGVVNLETRSPDGGRFQFLTPGGLGVANKGGTVVFHAVTSLGSKGLFVAQTEGHVASPKWTITKIVDNSTKMPIPGDHLFADTEDQVIGLTPDGSRTVFFGSNDINARTGNQRTGVFEWVRDEAEGAGGGTISCIANSNDTKVPLPRSSGNPPWILQGFGGITVANDGSVCFMAEAVNGVQPPVVGIFCRFGTDGKLQRMADSLMKIPGGHDPSGNPTDFQYVDYPSLSPDASTVVFQGNDDGGRRGVYSAQPASGGGGGTLKKLFDWQDKINEQTVFNIQMNFGSFDGVYVSFFIAWANTNEGIYSLSIF